MARGRLGGQLQAVEVTLRFASRIVGAHRRPSHANADVPAPDLGLALVRKLVEMHGGRVDAKREGRDLGTQITIRVPVSDATSMGRATAPIRETGAVICRALVVDDNEDAARMLAMLIEELGGESRMPTMLSAGFGVSKSSGRRSCCSTFECPAWMDTRPVAGCVRFPAAPISSW